MMDSSTNEPGSMDIMYLLERLEEVIGSGRPVPFTSRTLIDDEECFAIIDQIRLSLPNELRQARMVNAERDALLDEARARSEQIVKMAEAEAQERVRDHYITQQAQARSEDILDQADRDATKTRQDADDYVYRALIELDQHLDSLSNQVRNGINALRTSRETIDFPTVQQEETYNRPTRGWGSEGDEPSDRMT
jgi:vacuolar-type H+-ATPase subunit H